MMQEIYIPQPLYDYWPALCVCIAVAYGMAGVPMVAGGMIIYAGVIWYNRLIR